MDRYAKELNVNGNFYGLNDTHIELIYKYLTFVHSTDSEKLAEILLQRPIDLRGPQLSSSHLTDTDIAYFQREAKEHFDVVLDTLKKMPRNMLLVIR